jgi:hypothetical protein
LAAVKKAAEHNLSFNRYGWDAENNNMLFSLEKTIKNKLFLTFFTTENNIVITSCLKIIENNYDQQISCSVWRAGRWGGARRSPASCSQLYHLDVEVVALVRF